MVVDNGSTDDTASYLATVADGNRICVRNLKKPGLGRARNVGWQAASGEIIAFTDDDCYVGAGLPVRDIPVSADYPQVGFAAGRILLFDERDKPVTIKESQELVHFAPHEFIPAGSVTGANMAFRRSVLERIGGFDERLGAGTRFPSEDIDAAALAIWAGFPGVYDPRPVVFHDHGRRTDDDVAKLRRAYDAGRGAYYVKHIFRLRSGTAYLRGWLG